MRIKPMGIKETNLYDVLKPLEASLKIASQVGQYVPCHLFRDLAIYEDFQNSTLPKMERYIYIADKFKITERLVRHIIRKLSAKTQQPIFR